MGTERVFFESQMEQLRMGYEASVQKLVDAWESSSVTISVLARKRFREVRIITFYGTLVLRCREGHRGERAMDVPGANVSRTQA
jgi:hypothetical protein